MSRFERRGCLRSIALEEALQRFRAAGQRGRGEGFLSAQGFDQPVEGGHHAGGAGLAFQRDAVADAVGRAGAENGGDLGVRVVPLVVHLIVKRGAIQAFVPVQGDERRHVVANLGDLVARLGHDVRAGGGRRAAVEQVGHGELGPEGLQQRALLVGLGVAVVGA